MDSIEKLTEKFIEALPTGPHKENDNPEFFVEV